MYIYIVYSFCTTLPIAWQSICDLRSCKAMTLVRFISLSCHFIFFYIFFFCFLFFFFSLTSFVSAGSERQEGGSDPAFMMERTGTLGITFFSVIFLFFHLDCLSVSPQVQQCLLSENTGNISGIKSGERRRNIPSMDMQHPVDNRWTEGLAHHPAGPRADDRQWGWRDEMVPLSMSQRERERVGIDFSMMAHNWSTSWMPVVSPALGEEIRRQKRMKIGNKVEEGKKKYTVF